MGLHCALCGGPCGPYLAKLYDDRFGYPGRFDLFECSDCGHRQLDATFSDAELGRLYSEHYPRRASPADFVPYQESGGLRAWLDGDRASAFRWVPAQVRVLDIGSGAGRALAYHKARGCDAWGVEADEDARTVAGRHGLNVRIGVFDPAMFEAGSFDYVTLDQVIEHAVDPIKLLRGAAALLRGGGHAILSTPNSHGYGARLFGRRWINWHVPYHLHQFSRASLARAARDAGLETVSLRTLTPSSWLLYQWLHLATLPAPGEYSALWDPERSKRTIPRLSHRAAGEAHRLRLTHLATRAADALGAGDNFLCVLRKPASPPGG
jgi:SAM-dependent methyltransferase